MMINKNVFYFHVAILLSFFICISGTLNLYAQEDSAIIYEINNTNGLLWLSDPTNFDVNGDGINEFSSTDEKYAAIYFLSSDIIFNADSSRVDWNADGEISESDSTGFHSIGNAEHPFTGSLIGGAYSISNLYCNSNSGYTGLFGEAKGALISDLRLDHLKIISRGSYNAGFVGRATQSTAVEDLLVVRNCRIEGTFNIQLDGNNTYSGGVVGRSDNVEILNTCTFLNAESDTAAGNRRVGGIAGQLSGYALIDNCYSISEIMAFDQSGLLAGRLFDGNITLRNSYAIGKVYGPEPDNSLGILVGLLNNGSLVSLYYDQDFAGITPGVGTADLPYSVTPLHSNEFSDSLNFDSWDFENIWYMAGETRPHLRWEGISPEEFDIDSVMKELLNTEYSIMKIFFEPGKNSVSGVLEDGLGDFDPWNTSRWGAWYNEEGQITRCFELDTNVVFADEISTWSPVFSPDYEFEQLFNITVPGVQIEGNNLVIDKREEPFFQSLEALYSLGRDPWLVISNVSCFFYNLIESPSEDTTRIMNLEIKGFDRGFRHTNLTDSHPVLLDSCAFIRNNFGMYSNGHNLFVRNCDFLENGNGGIYAGHNSHEINISFNRFRDNNIAQYNASYADIIGDCVYDSKFYGNQFLPSLYGGSQVLRGISFYRNQGEDDNLREQIPRNNIIRNNHFEEYSVGIHLGARQGRNVSYDITGEGRDYAFNNIIDSNTFVNSVIGIKLNVEGNTIENNSFSNVNNEIVLQCVFFKLGKTVINDQPGNTVTIWATVEDYPAYTSWFPYQGQLNQGIEKNEKKVVVVSESGTPEFQGNNGLLFELNPVEDENSFLDDHRVGLPLFIAKGELAPELPGIKTAAIWADPVTRIKGTDEYTIIIYDEEGYEVNRSGLSTIPWKEIAAGYFKRLSGEMEIAAVPTLPVNGKYPVYIFDRGYREPKQILFTDNTNPNIHISVDENFHLVVSFSSDNQDLIRNSPAGKIQLIPNPARDEIYIGPGSLNQNIRIFNIHGKQLLMLHHLDEGFQRIDISRFAPGMYIVVQEDGKTVSFIKR